MKIETLINYFLRPQTQVGDITSWLLSVTVYADLGTEMFDGVVLGVLVADRTRVLKPKSVKSMKITNANYSYVGVEEFVFDEASNRTVVFKPCSLASGLVCTVFWLKDHGFTLLLLPF